MKFDFYDISINFDKTMSINESYSSKKILTTINNLLQINGTYAEIKSSNQNSLKKKIPLFSLIYCKEGLYTDFTFDQYKYKNITDTTQMYYISKDQCISYDPSKIFINLNSIFIEINIWNEVFDYPELDIDIEIKKVTTIPRTVYIDFIDYEWINRLFYKKENVFENVKKELKNSENYSIKQNDMETHGYLIIFDKCPLLQRKKYNELQKYKINELIEIITTKNKYPYKIIRKYLQYDLCRWIKEDTKEEKNIEKTTFFKFMKFFLETLGNDFKKIFSFDERLQINFVGVEIISSYKLKGTFTALISLNKCKINDNDLNIGDVYLCSSSEEPILNNEYIAIYIDFVL